MDTNQEATTAKVGKTVLFMGTYTVNWSIAEFEQAAQFARSLGIDSLAVKCQDGSTRWYDSQGGLDAVKNALHKHGCGFVPYAYLYGNKLGALEGEIAVLKELMVAGDGCCCADMEQEWDGHADWAETFNNAMRPVEGLLYITTWADPHWQNWDGVIAALRPCTNAWIPQEYDNFLTTTENQFPGGLNIEPAINLPEAWPGPNDPVAAARTAVARGHTTVWLWEYGLAQKAPDVVRSIVAVMGGAAPAQGGGGSIGGSGGGTSDGLPTTCRVGVWPHWDGSLSGMAQHYYGDAAKWEIIWHANLSTVGNPNVLHPGQVLTIPAL